MNFKSSEVVCAQRMLSIANGTDRLLYEDYTVAEIAHRYAVTRDAAYRGIRRGSLLYPEVVKLGDGPKAWVTITRDAIMACDARRIAFYKTTPSWMKLSGLDWVKPPKRIAASVLLVGATGG